MIHSTCDEEYKNRCCRGLGFADLPLVLVFTNLRFADRFDKLYQRVYNMHNMAHCHIKLHKKNMVKKLNPLLEKGYGGTIPWGVNPLM